MAKPAREMSWPENSDPELEFPDDEEEDEEVMLQRWVERAGGGFELLEMPLTLELYLNPRLGDKLTQGELHADLMAELKELLGRHFRTSGTSRYAKHQFSPRRGPSPDISIVRGVRNPDLKRSSFNVVKEGVVAEERATREELARKAAEERTKGAEESRKAAEKELARLRAQIERLKKSAR